MRAAASTAIGRRAAAATAIAQHLAWADAAAASVELRQRGGP
jgi:hypothetical protein